MTVIKVVGEQPSNSHLSIYLSIYISIYIYIYLSIYPLNNEAEKWFHAKEIFKKYLI